MSVSEGRDKFIIKKTIIELRKDQYVIKNAYRKPIVPTKITRSRNFLPMDDDFEFDDEGYVIPHGVSFMDPKVVSTILCNYSGLKEAAWGEFEKDVAGIHSRLPNITPRVTECMPNIISFIDNLVKIGAAYVVDDDVYFKVESDDKYPEIMKEYFNKVVPYQDNMFSALNTAV